MNSMDKALTAQLPHELELRCPYSDISDVCNASLSSLLPTPTVRTKFCNTDDYDYCPIFLAKALRRRRK